MMLAMVDSSWGAASAAARNPLIVSGVAGSTSRPPRIVSTGWSRNWNLVATPKLPPPPRMAQNSKSPDNCRQIAVRARRQVQAKKPRFEASRRKREELSRRFFEAVEADDTQGLVGLLAADVVLYGDGGGKAPAILRPVYGRERVVRVVGEFRPWSQRLGVRSVRHVEVNGQPGALYLDADGHPVAVVSLDIADDLSRPCTPSSTPTSSATSPHQPTPTEGGTRTWRGL